MRLEKLAQQKIKPNCANCSDTRVAFYRKQIFVIFHKKYIITRIRSDFLKNFSILFLLLFFQQFKFHLC